MRGIAIGVLSSQKANKQTLASYMYVVQVWHGYAREMSDDGRNQFLESISRGR